MWCCTRYVQATEIVVVTRTQEARHGVKVAGSAAGTDTAAVGRKSVTCEIFGSSMSHFASKVCGKSVDAGTASLQHPRLLSHACWYAGMLTCWHVGRGGLSRTGFGGGGFSTMLVQYQELRDARIVPTLRYGTHIRRGLLERPVEDASTLSAMARR
jgi:hypothetical protein